MASRLEPSAMLPKLTKAILAAFLIPVSLASVVVTPDPAFKYTCVSVFTLKNKSNAIYLPAGSPGTLALSSFSSSLVVVRIYCPLWAGVSDVSITP